MANEEILQFRRIFDGWLFDVEYEDDVHVYISHYVDICTAIHHARMRLVAVLQGALEGEVADFEMKKRLHYHLSRLNTERRSVMDDLLMNKVDYFEGQQGYRFTVRKYWSYSIYHS
jgi:hypothetical protein